MSTGNIIQLFLDAANKTPSRVALIRDSRSITYAQLLDEVKENAGYYQKKGIGKHSKVLVFLPMGIDLYRVVLALFYVGACPVFLDEWVDRKRLTQCCRLVPCDTMIAGRKVLLLSFFVSGLRNIRKKLFYKNSGSEAVGAPADINAADTALITFTTGSTGVPKAADRTHAYLYAQYAALQPLIDNGTQLSFVSLPIVVLINLALGKTTLLPPSLFSARHQTGIDHIANRLVADRVEEIICSPSLLQNLLSLPGTGSSSSLRFIFTGGGPVFPDQAEEIRTVLKDVKGLIVYGSTEAEPISHIDLRELAATDPGIVKSKGLPVGKVDTAVSLAIISFRDAPIPDMTKDEFETLKRSPGQPGEIVVTGAHVLKEYINNPEAVSRHKINVAGETWHRTGDMGRVDEHGRLFLLGSCKEVFAHNGNIYYPFVTAYLFRTLAGAQQVAVLLHNNRLTVVVAADTKIDEHLLETAMRETRLQDATISYLQNLPTDPRHRTKIDYDRLREML